MDNNQNPIEFNGQENAQYNGQQYGAPNNAQYNGQQYGAPNGQFNQQYGAPNGGQPKQKLVAALLALFLGGFGIHHFYLGDNKIELVQHIEDFYEVNGKINTSYHYHILIRK